MGDEHLRDFAKSLIAETRTKGNQNIPEKYRGTDTAVFFRLPNGSTEVMPLGSRDDLMAEGLTGILQDLLTEDRGRILGRIEGVGPAFYEVAREYLKQCTPDCIPIALREKHIFPDYTKNQ